MTVSASSRARRTRTARARSTSSRSRSPAARQLESQSSVDDVAAREAEVEVAAVRADRLGDLTDERDDVMVGRQLDLGDPIDVDRRPRRDRLVRRRRDETASDLGSGDGELDPQHLLPARLVRPDGAHLGQRVAPDHAGAPTGPPRHRGRTAARPRCRADAASRATRSRRPPSPPASARPPRPAPGRRPSAPVRRSSRSRPRVAAGHRRAMEDERRHGLHRRDTVDRVRQPSVSSDNPSPRGPRRRPRREAPASAPGHQSGRAPRAAASNHGPRATASRGSITCVSGSPSLALHSSRTGPRVGQHEAGIQEPPERVPRRASSVRMAAWVVRMTSSTSSAGRSGRREYAPMPPVFGPRSPSHNRLWSRAGRQRHGPLAVADRDDARLVPDEALLDDQGRSVRGTAGDEPRDELEGLVKAVGDTMTPLPAASPSALRTMPRPAAASSRRRPRRRVRPRR